MDGLVSQPLAAALGACDEHAFSSLLDRYYGPMLRFANAVVADPEVAKAGVFRAWERALGEEAQAREFPSFAAWLFAHVLAALDVDRLELSPPDHLSAIDPDCFEARDDRWAGHWRDDAMPSPWAPDGVEARVRAVRAGLCALPAPLAALVALNDVERFSALEITAVLGFTSDTQPALLNRARAMLRHAVDQQLVSSAASP